MHTLESLTKKALDFREARDWKQFHKPKDVAISLMLEAAEVAEHFQWKNESEMREHIETHREEIGEELADVLFWVLTMAHDMGVDLGPAFLAKISKNELKYPVAEARGRHTKYTQLKGDKR